MQLIDMLGVIPRVHARYLVHPKLLFPVRIAVKNAILRARARSLTTVKLLYLVRVRMCGQVNRCSNMLIFRSHTQGETSIRISM